MVYMEGSFGWQKTHNVQHLPKLIPHMHNYAWKIKVYDKTKSQYNVDEGVARSLNFAIIIGDL